MNDLAPFSQDDPELSRARPGTTGGTDTYLSTRQLRAVPASLRFYRLPHPLDDALLRQAVGHAQLPSTPPRLTAQFGFQAFLPPEALATRELDHFFADAGGYRCLRFMTAQRKIAPATFKRALAQRLAEFSKLAGRPPQGRELNVLESEVSAKLMPLSPIEETESLIIIDPSRTRVALEARSPKAADKLVEALRDSLGSFPCEPVRAAMPVERALTLWLSKQTLPGQFAFGSKVTLRDSSKQAASLTNHDLGSAEVMEHIAGGKLVQSIELIHEPLFALVANSESTFSSIRPLQAEDKKGPSSPEELAAIGCRLWPAIFAAASSFFRGLVATHQSTTRPALPPAAGDHASAPALVHAS